MTEDRPSKRTWAQKFRDAFRGTVQGIRGQSSFTAHFLMTFLVIVAAIVLRANLIEWCILVLAITVVMCAEMFNSALESLAKAIDVEHNLHLADGLDIGSAAVLLAACGASVVGLIVFLYRLFTLLGLP